MTAYKANTMTHTLILLLTTVLLGVNSQTTDSQSPLAPPTGVGSDDSPALVANDPALVSAIVQGVINEVGAVTRQSEEPVHVTPQLVQDIVQKVLLKLSVTLTQLEPGFPAAPQTPSGPVNRPAAGSSRTNADTANPGNKTESTGPHVPPVLTDAFGNLIHRLHPHHDDDNSTDTTNADTANPTNKTESRGMHLPHLHDIAETLGNLFHRNNNNNSNSDSNGSADNVNADSADPANKTESGGLRLPARLHNLADNLRNFFHRHHDGNDTDSTQADSADPANRTEASGPHLPHLHNLADNLRNFFHRHGNNDSDADNTSADSADPSNRTESGGLHLHNITHALDGLFHHHHHHHHRHNDTSRDDADNDNKSTNATSGDKDISRNSAASNGENFPPQPPNPRRLGDNSNNISNAASVQGGKNTASNDSATITVEPRRGYTYPTLHLGGVENKALSKEQICQQPPVPGLCRGYMPRFHYNATAGACTRFIYGGCGGNQNNFKTEEECTTFCAP